mgnify:CR=1 FL=1
MTIFKLLGPIVEARTAQAGVQRVGLQPELHAGFEGVIGKEPGTDGLGSPQLGQQCGAGAAEAKLPGEDGSEDRGASAEAAPEAEEEASPVEANDAENDQIAN